MKKTLDDCVEQFKKENMDIFNLTFRGIGNFSNRVVFAKLQRDKNYFRLQRLGGKYFISKSSIFKHAFLSELQTF